MFKGKLFFVQVVPKNLHTWKIINAKLEPLLSVMNFMILKIVVLSVKTDISYKTIPVNNIQVILIVYVIFGVKELRTYVIGVNQRQQSLRRSNTVSL